MLFGVTWNRCLEHTNMFAAVENECSVHYLVGNQRISFALVDFMFVCLFNGGFAR